MIALIQRVKRASVTVGDHVTGQIEQGLLVLLCAELGLDMNEVVRNRLADNERRFSK